VSKLWGGRFSAGQDPAFESFNQSLRFDARLWREDIRGSVAWARAIAAAGVLARDECETIVAALGRIAGELERDPSPLASSAAEDIHSFVEDRLRVLTGDLARKLHTGRSRNDQVATDLKLWLRGASEDIERATFGLVRALVDLAERNAALPMPGYTHMQRAQPITVGHHLLAYVEMLARDRSRFADARQRMDACPLGSGALAGNAFGVDRAALARELGFAGPSTNSLDAVSDRDHACEIAFACALALVHLSRFAEDWIFFATREAGFLELSDAVATGSSLMPQKKNPDSLELVRGKCARVIGDLQALLVTLKGLPLAYDKDLQEDKEALFDAVDTTRACLEIATLVVNNARFDPDRCRAEAASGHSNATDLADLLVARGVPFRSAHERAGAAVRAAIELDVELEALPANARAELLPELAGADLGRELSVDAVLARRNSIGGTSPERVREEIARRREELRAWDRGDRAHRA
jgi:argininosuccinate lyase